MRGSPIETPTAATRERAELVAAVLFVGCALTMAVVCGSVIISGWFAGAIADPPERFFWAGAVLAGLAIPVLASAAVPWGGDDAAALRRIRVLLRIGVVMFTLAPGICVGALVVNFFAY